MKNQVYNIDCMEFMKDISDKFYDLAIVDPPYGIGEDGGKDRRRKSKHIKKNWDNKIPDKIYFDELFRISKNQIIWGANYFTEFIPPSMGWIFWDKKKENSDFSDGELAYSSFNRALKKFTYSKTGGNIKLFSESFIHPCMKPIKLYKWLLRNYAKPGQKIIDTHVGSGSIRIACHDLGFDFTGCELDKDYWQAQEDRYKKHIQQNELFEKKEIQGLVFNELPPNS